MPVDLKEFQRILESGPGWKIQVRARTAHSPLIGEQAPAVYIETLRGPGCEAVLTARDARRLAMALINAADFSEGL